jgi:hypothetical protein
MGYDDPPRPQLDIPSAYAVQSSAALAAPETIRASTVEMPAPPDAAQDAPFEPAASDVTEESLPSPAEAEPAPTEIRAASTAPIAGATLVALAPLVGVPEGPAASLEQALRNEAGSHGMRLASGSERLKASLVIKGYLATMPKEGGSAVVHIWDVYDPEGERLTRIDGEEQEAAGGDWADLPPEAWAAIADDALARLADWLKSRPG